jgi:hypothetical protein
MTYYQKVIAGLGVIATLWVLMSIGDTLHTDKEAEVGNRRNQAALNVFQTQVLAGFEALRILTLQGTTESRIRAVEIQLSILRDKLAIIETANNLTERERGTRVWFANRDIGLLDRELEAAQRQLAFLQSGVGP